MIRLLTTDSDLQTYDAWVHGHPHRNLWQSLEWKRYQESLGRSVKIYAMAETGKITASAMVMIDKTVLGLSVWDIPRGPLGTTNHQFLDRIISDAKADRCMALYLSAPETLLSSHSLQYAPSKRCEQLEATIMLDLTQSEEEILAGMHQKARYNIKTARRHGVEIETYDSHISTKNNLDAFYTLLQGTGSRDGFKIHQKSHYERFLSDLESIFILMARHEGKAIAGVMGVIWNGTGIYYYGASSYESRHLMAPYLLQWEAILHCKKAGCTRYDLLGIAPEGSAKDNPWAGITDFKRKFGGTVVNYPPEQMVVLRPIAKRMLEWKRKVIG